MPIPLPVFFLPQTTFKETTPPAEPLILRSQAGLNTKFIPILVSLPQTTFKETTPPAEPLILRSQIVRIRESDTPGSKATVQVRPVTCS